ncbi:MAG: transporter substrate-binding domain-containing protein [Nibricoccus sp.]
MRRFFLWLLLATSGFAQPAAALEKPVARPVRIGVFNDNAPFSHGTASGQVEGFAVDLLAAVERTMGLRFERVTGSTDVISTAFNERRIDALQSFAQTPARELHADFTVPYLSMSGSIFARKNSPPIHSLADLRGRRVMVHAGSLGEQLLHAAGLDESIVHVESVEQALRKLNAGENDATLVSRLTGLASAHQLGLKNIGPVGEPVPDYTVRYCFAVQDGDRELLAKLNEGLAILQRTGEFERIYRRWFGHVDPLPGYSALEIAMATSAGLTVALIIALWAVVRQRRLREHLAAQAEALRASEERYRGVFETSQEGLLLLHPSTLTPPDFALEEANQAALNMLGLDKAPPAGTSLRGLSPCCTDCCDVLGQALAAGGPMIFEHTTPPGRASHTALRVSVTRISQRVLIVLSDLTETRRAAEQLRLREQQLRQNQKLEALGTLAGGVAHDFNNILTSILGNTDIAGLDLPPGSSVHAQLDEIRAASERARQLVRQILTFTRQTESRIEVISITPLIDECLRFIRASVRSSITIRHQPASDSPQIEADATQIHQVVMNLCTNAVHAMGDSAGTLEITEDTLTVTPEIVAQHPQLYAGDFMRVAIRDSGCGMTPEILQRMFEPFFTTKAPGQGTGLGLAVVHGIMQNHRGAITVYSKPGQGTLFHLYFPRTARTVSSDNAASSTHGTLNGRGQRILFVDDEQPIVRAASHLLTRLGYAVSAHHEVMSALAEFEKNSGSVALVITDLTMPKMTGLEFIQRIRAARPGLPVILISGFMNEADLSRARELGINRVLDKPLTLAALGRTVKECLPGA